MTEDKSPVSSAFITAMVARSPSGLGDTSGSFVELAKKTHLRGQKPDTAATNLMSPLNTLFAVMNTETDELKD